METLGYGTHLVVDGHSAGEVFLGDERYALKVATEILQGFGLSSEDALTLTHRARGGVSVGVALPESHLTLHTFSALQKISVGVFSRQTLAFGEVHELLEVRFEVGRLESHLGSRSVALSQDEARARTFLLGERAYTGLRLDDALLALEAPSS